MKRELLAAALFLGLTACGGGRATSGLAAPAPAAQQKDRNSTSAETTVKPSEGDLSLADVLRTKAPGLQITQLSNGNYEIYIRGAAQDAGGAPPPLVVVDGMPVTNLNDEFRTLNPKNVATVTILRDVASTAMYGTQGAGGVILITTKHQ